MRWVALVLTACGQAPAQVAHGTPPTPERPVSAARIEVQSSAGFDRGLDVAFDNAPPSFAYVHGDEAMVFDYDRSAIDGPRRSSFVRYKLGNAKASERLPIIDDELWRTWVEPPPVPTVETLHRRATAVNARIRGMEPLTRISDWLDVSTTKAPVTVSIGRARVTARTAGPALALELAHNNKRLAYDEIKAFETAQQHQEDEAWLRCEYDPNELAVYSDGDRVLVVVRYHHSIDCDDRDHAVRLWSIR